MRKGMIAPTSPLVSTPSAQQMSKPSAVASEGLVSPSDFQKKYIASEIQRQRITSGKRMRVKPKMPLDVSRQSAA